MNNNENAFSQGIAAYVNTVNELRLQDFQLSIDAILNEQSLKIKEVIQYQVEAIKHLDFAKIGIDTLKNTNRGGDTGIHGFIAESAEVGIANSQRALEGLNENMFLIDNNGPVDLMKGSKAYQMKYYQNPLGALDQAASYRDMGMMYPKDQMQLFKEVMDNKENIKWQGQKLSSRKVIAIRKRITDESTARNQPFEEWAKASHSNYDEVQRETIQKTMNKEYKNVKDVTQNRKNTIKEESSKQQETARQQAMPSLKETAKVAVIGGAIQGGLEFGMFVYSQKKNGKNIWEFNREDWISAGIVVGKGSLKGSVQSLSIYGLTNYLGVSAPAASALISSTWGISDAALRYRAKEIDKEEFMDLMMYSALNSSVSAFGGVLGQYLIPIPILGAIIGSMVANTVVDLGKNVLNDKEMKLIENYRSDIQEYVRNLEDEYKQVYNKLVEKFEVIDDLQEYLLNENVNIELNFIGSIKLAEALEVSEEAILYTEEDIDNYFLN